MGVLHDLNGGFIHSIALRREIRHGLGCKIKVVNRTGRNELGDSLVISSGISVGEIGDYPAVRKACVEIAEALGSLGPLNIQCRKAGNTIIPFEINPRFSGTTSSRALVGFNEPGILIRKHLLGEDPRKCIDHEYGYVAREYAEVIVGKQSDAG